VTSMDFIVLDELGYMPFAQSGGQLLFHLISRLYERSSILHNQRSNLGSHDHGSQCRTSDLGPRLDADHPVKGSWRLQLRMPLAVSEEIRRQFLPEAASVSASRQLSLRSAR